MTRLYESDNEGESEREIKLWLNNRGYSQNIYHKIPEHIKRTLYSLICAKNILISDRQLRDCYVKLQEIEGILVGRNSRYLIDKVSDEHIRHHFSPLKPSEKISYYDKF